MAKLPDTKAAKVSLIRSISDKAAKLLAQNRQLAEQCDKLGRRNLKLTEENDAMKQTLSTLKRRIAVLELNAGFSGNSDDRKKVQARINRLMREVDRCIALLSR